MTVKLLLSIIWIILGFVGLFINYIAAAGFLCLGSGDLVEYISKKKDRYEGEVRAVSIILQVIGIICLLIFVFSDIYESFS